MVDVPGDGVLLFSVFITRLMPNASNDRSRSPGTMVVAQGDGSIIAEAVWTDSQTGQWLARIGDNRTSRGRWGINNRVSNYADLKRAFTNWAKQFRARLDIVHG
jgi:hypothetical protein